MPGIVGIYPFGLGRENWRIARFVYYGLLALQHRGQESVAIATLGSELRMVSGSGMVDEALNEEEITSLHGFIGLGCVSPIGNDPLVVVDSPVRVVLAGDGRPLMDGDQGWRAFAEALSDEISRVKNPLKAAVKLVEEVDGGYSFIALTEDQVMLAGRDRRGVKPLEVGSLGFDLGVVASESCALDVLGMEHAGSIKPGEVVKFDPYSVERAVVRNASNPSYCSFEYVYLARPDSILNGVHVYAVRERIGEALAGESPIRADVVVGVPETAVPFAMGFSRASGIPVSLGFVTTGRKVRTAIKPSLIERLTGVQLKLNPVKSAIDGRDLVLIDDSVVRGTTLRSTVWNLKRRGARRVHVRIGSPPLRSSCPYGSEIPPPDELIARALTEDEIAEVIGADSFKFLSISGLVSAVGLPCENLCLKCWLEGGPC